MAKPDFCRLLDESEDKFEFINCKLHSIIKDTKNYKIVNEVMRSLIGYQIVKNEDFKSLFNQ